MSVPAPHGAAGVGFRPGPPRTGHKAYRADIEGLRGVAVLLVVLFHAGVPGASDGFIGVDVFFVLSGYLITELLVSERERTGSIDFVQFYARRTRRLLPAAVLVLGVTILLGALIFSPVEQVRYVKSALATSLYLSNVQFIRDASHYFAADMTTDPFLHTWSLAVEEQFYFFWPLLVLVGWAGLRSRRRLLQVIAGVCVVTFVACVWLTWVRKPWAFFASPARAWEFGLGGLACMIPPPLLRGRGMVWTCLGWAGLALILASAAVMSGEWLFPGAWALIPVVGTVAALLAGAGAPGAGVGAVLSARPFQTLGRLSYSWYLWHWPVLVGAAVLWPDLGLSGRLLAALVALGAAAVSFHAVENRIRFHPMLVTRPRASLALAGALSIAGLGFALAGYRYASHAATTPDQMPFWAAERDRSAVYDTHCLSPFEGERLKVCAFGDTTSQISVVLMGDSHAAHWFAALDRIATEQHWRLVTMIKAGCPTADVPIYDPRVGHEVEACADWRQAAISRIVDLEPTAVVLANSVGYVRRPNRAGGYSRASIDDWEQGNRRTLSALNSAGVRTILLRDSPRPGIDVPVCLSRARYHARTDAGCMVPRAMAVENLVFDAERRAADGLLHVAQADFSDLFCDLNACPPVRDGMVVYSDDNHLTATYARSVGPQMRITLAGLMGVDPAVETR